MDCFFFQQDHHTTFQILSSDDRSASTTLAREHGALHPSVHPRTGNRLHGRYRHRSVQQQSGDPECAGSEALHSLGQRVSAAMGGAGLSQSSVRARG